MKLELTGELRTAFSRRSLSNFFTIARFGPDTITIFSVLSALTLVLYYWGLGYLSIPVILTLAILFCIESTETISLSRAEYREIVGAKCLVVRGAVRDNRGIVQLYNSDGTLDPELWSAESAHSLEDGAVAKVTGMRSVILEIAPKER
jgi:hypothetical protein